jgi:hypothetical protein
MIRLLQTSLPQKKGGTQRKTFNAEIADIAEWSDRFDAAPRSGGDGARRSEYKPDEFVPGLYF